MPRSRRCAAPGRRRAAQRSTPRSSRARITARRRPASTPFWRRASRASFRRWKIPIRRSPARATRGCASRASRWTSGSGSEEALRAHVGHFRRVREGRLHVTLKLAVSADGKPGCPPQTGRDHRRAARTRVHQMRAMNDAVLTGIGTVLSDDPQLTCRLPGMQHRSPVDPVAVGGLRPACHQTLSTTPSMYLRNSHDSRVLPIPPGPMTLTRRDWPSRRWRGTGPSGDAAPRPGPRTAPRGFAAVPAAAFGNHLDRPPGGHRQALALEGLLACFLEGDRARGARWVVSPTRT